MPTSGKERPCPPIDDKRIDELEDIQQKVIKALTGEGPWPGHELQRALTRHGDVRVASDLLGLLMLTVRQVSEATGSRLPRSSPNATPPFAGVDGLPFPAAAWDRVRETALYALDGAERWAEGEVVWGRLRDAHTPAMPSSRISRSTVHRAA